MVTITLTRKIKKFQVCMPLVKQPQNTQGKTGHNLAIRKCYFKHCNPNLITCPLFKGVLLFYEMLFLHRRSDFSRTN